MSQWLHRHPEHAINEHKTTEYIKSILLDSGVRMLDINLETCLIAVIGAGNSPTIALRADIDALPIQEQTSLPYASETPEVMHACGHDFHAACLLGATLLLKVEPHLAVAKDVAFAATALFCGAIGVIRQVAHIAQVEANTKLN